jgi:hypothetical protein
MSFSPNGPIPNRLSSQHDLVQAAAPPHDVPPPFSFCHHEFINDLPGHEGHQRGIRAEYLNFNDDGTIQTVEPTGAGISLDSLNAR